MTRPSPVFSKRQKRETAGQGVSRLALPGRTQAILPFPGGQAAPDVPLGFVGVQDDLHLFVQGLVVLGQALGEVLVDRGFGDPKFFRRCPDGGPVFDHVHSQLAGSLSDVIRHTRPSLLCRDKILYAGKRAGMSSRKASGRVRSVIRDREIYFVNRRFLPGVRGKGI